ncbi:MAG: DUF2029 domain-containing protein [Chloroflexi bacterium]|nr:DUF2029 domain-containing protein [Chloroflexota bacterium]
MKSARLVLHRLWFWAKDHSTKRELAVGFFALVAFYLTWALVVKPVAMDFNIYRFSGYAYHEGLSPYAESPAAFELASRYSLVPFAPPYRYPPLMTQVMSVLVLLPYPVLRTLFTLASTAAFCFGIWAISKSSLGNVPRFLLLAAVLFLPVLNCIAAGQINLFMLGALAGMIYLMNRSSTSGTSLRSELIAGGLWGLTLVFKPVLWPLALWAVFRRRIGVLVGCVCVAALLGVVSLLTAGAQPWLDYLNVLRSFASPDPYVENQSLIGFIARVAGPNLARIAQFASPVVILGIWFLLFRNLPPDLELAALASISVLISPVAWYYYGVLLIPAFWLLADRYRHSARWLGFGLLGAYGLIQLHQLTWYRFPAGSILTDLAFFGMALLVLLVFASAYNLSRAPAVSKVTALGA